MSDPSPKPRRTLAETMAIVNDAHQRVMSRNVPKCPTLRQNRFSRLPPPLPPELPDAPVADDVIVATQDDATLSPAQRIALAALACGETIMSAARKADVSPRTIHRWRQEPAFAQTLDRLSRDAMEAAATRMRGLLLRATHVIADALHDGQTNWAMRVVTSKQIWSIGERLPAAPEDADAPTDPAGDAAENQAE